MKRGIASIVIALSTLTASRALAQTEMAGPGVLEVTLIPGGGTYFMDRSNSPSFGNYDVGGSVTFNVTRFVGVEGEVGGTLGISQDLQFGGPTRHAKTPNIVNYSGNLIVSAPLQSGLTPYVTGGVGGLTLMKTAELGISDVTTLFTGNVGGGLKWYANSRWGLRADYRFLAVQSKDDGPAFLGREVRYGHRIYGGVVINALR